MSASPNNPKISSSFSTGKDPHTQALDTLKAGKHGPSSPSDKGADVYTGPDGEFMDLLRLRMIPAPDP